VDHGETTGGSSQCVHNPLLSGSGARRSKTSQELARSSLVWIECVAVMNPVEQI
jgi:hypothetical protein